MKRFLFVLSCLVALLMFAGPPAFALTVTKTAGLNQEITSITSDGTYNYLGAVDGNIYKQTISTGAVAAAPIAGVGGRITNLVLNGTTLYVTVAGGSVYTVAAASSATMRPVLILDNVTGPTASQSYGSIDVVNAAITVTLPTAVAGMSICVVDSGTAHDIIIDVQSADTVALLGAADTAGDGITNASGSSLGDFACLVSNVAGKWIVMERQGTWAQQ